MKKVLLTSIVLLAAAQGAQAEIYSCGPGCYTSNAKKGSGKADIGTKIGSYTSVKPRTRPQRSRCQHPARRRVRAQSQ